MGQLRPFPYPTPPPRGPVPLGGVAPAPARAIGAFDEPFPSPQRTPAPDTLPSGPKVDQSINFRKAPVVYYRDPDFPLYATATSGLSVRFTATGDCSLYGSYVHVISAGRCTVTAHQPGDVSRFDAAPDVDQVIPISKASQSINFAALSPKKFLDPAFGLYASATSGLSVVFQAGGDCRVSGSMVQLVAAGSCWVTAHQPGDANFTAARIVDQQFEIAKGDQTITFTPLPSPDWWGATFVLQATASSGLPVVFTAKGSCLVAGDGGILQYVDYGSCSVTAEQPGNANVNPAPSVSQTFTIDAPLR